MSVQSERCDVRVCDGGGLLGACTVPKGVMVPGEVLVCLYRG